MRIGFKGVVIVGLFLSSLLPTADPAAGSTASGFVDAYARLPVRFEKNEGQVDKRIRFLARGRGYTLLLADTEARLSLGGLSSVFRMRLEGSRRRPVVRGLDELEGKTNYFVGNDPTKWRTGVPTFGRVKYERVYPHIDLICYGNEEQLEYDFVIAPGGDPRRIRLSFPDSGSVTIDETGDLVVAVAAAELRQQKPFAYQLHDGVRRPIPAVYVLRKGGEVGFQVGRYDRNAPLVIDPVVRYSTYVGGAAGDEAAGITVDPAGFAYIVGSTESVNFPAGGTPAPVQTANGGNYDVFVLKLNNAGTGFVWSTYLGGAGDDFGRALAIDSLANPFVTGQTYSNNFPTGRFPSGNVLQAASGGGSDAFVTKLNAVGAVLTYSTYLGGSGDDAGTTIAVDASGSAFVAGSTESNNFRTANAVQSAAGGRGDAFVTKVNAAGDGVAYSTYIGGSNWDKAWGIAVDSGGSAYVAGETLSTDFRTAGPFQSANAGDYDAFVLKLNPAGSGLSYATYLGGTAGESGTDVAVDSAGNAYVTGLTFSSSFPTLNPLQETYAGGGDAFVSKLNAAGNALVYSTYLGGGVDAFGFPLDIGWGIAVDASGNAYVTGETATSDFPIETAVLGFRGDIDVFVSKLNAAGDGLVYSTYLGGSSEDSGRAIAIDSAGSAYVTGYTSSTNFAVTTPVANSGGRDVFAAKLSPSSLDISLVKTHSGNFTVGNNGVYTLTLTNLGATATSGTVTVTDNLPNGLSYVSGSGNSWACLATGQTASCFRADPIPAGETTSITLTVSVAAAAYPRVVNTATVTLQNDTNIFNNLSTAVTPVGAATFSVADRGAVVLSTPGTAASATIGYARILRDAGSFTPAGLAIFGLRQGGVLVTEAGVPGAPLVRSGRIYAEVSGAVNTGIAIANPASQDATISYFFTDSNGNNFGKGTTNIAANGQIAAFLNENPFNGGAAINGAFTFTSTQPVAVVALRGLQNERSEFLITTLPVAELTANIAETAILAHFADGGGWSTQVVLVNPTDEWMNGSVEFWSQGGPAAAAQPLTLTVDGRSARSFSYVIAPRSSRKMRTGGANPETSVGSVRIVPMGLNRTPSALAIFSFKNSGITVSEAAVPALRAARAVRMYAELSSEVATGVSITNPSQSPVTAILEVTPLSGLPLLNVGRLTIPANGQVARFLNQIEGLESLQVPFQGVLRITTAAQQFVNIMGLRGRSNERGDFIVTTTPPVDESSPAGNELVFPHFVDGGGYRADFVIFNRVAGRRASGVIGLFAQSGQALDLQLRAGGP